MPILNPYLHFENKAEEAFNFYKSVFGGEFAMFQRFKDMPQDASDAEGCGPMPAADAEKVMHVALPIGETNVLMGCDIPTGMEEHMKPGGNFAISVDTDSEEETDRLFNALSEGGHVTMALNKTFWNSYFGMCRDKFGISWMVSYDIGP